MMTIAKLTPGRANYYCEQLPGGADEYYTDSREEPGVWLGEAAARLGLCGRVDPDDFRAVLDARHPRTGDPLGVPVTTAKRLGGFDLCLSAPKSVSVAWALAPPEIAEQIAAGHDAAVAQTVAALEDEAVRARRGAGGARSVITEGAVAAGFGHRTSRAGDPQIHTHLVVANLTQDRSGRWSAIDGTRIYGWAKTLGYLYQAALRQELTDRLGVEWAPVFNGHADLAGIGPEALEVFSKRTAQIDQALGVPAAHVPAAVAKTATLATRARKDDVPDLGTLRHRWAAEANQIGLEPASLAELTGRPASPPVDIDGIGDRLAGAPGLTAHTSTFDRRDVLQALASAHPAGSHPATLAAHADRFLARADVVELDGNDRRSGSRYSTRELLDIEARMLAGASRRRDEQAGVARLEDVDRALADRPSLSVEQARMVESLTRSGAGVEVVEGRAGAGKTFALDAARQAWQDSGHRVIGATLAARAAAELQSGAGIPSTTLDRLLADLDRPGPLSGLPARTVVVVDETGMVGTRKLARLLDHAQRAGAKVVLVGDPRQLPEIEAGGALAALAKVVPTTELVDNRRQHHAWERQALAELRSGSVTAAFDAYTAAGRITLAPTAAATRQALVDDWWAAERAGGSAVMYALRRADVDDLNRRARQQLELSGRLGPERVEAAGREYASGDRVICLRNDRRLGVRNGTTATITDVDRQAGEVTLSDGTRLPRHYLDDGHLGYAYCTTIHKGQGATVDRAFLLGSAGLYREAGYVGLSGGRQHNAFYITAPTPDRHHPELDPVIETTRRLANSRAQSLATEQGPVRTSLVAPGRTDHHAAVLADPAPWMVDALGPPPLAGPEREPWARDALRLEAYRDIYRITDTRQPIGPEPADPDQRRAWALVRMTIDDRQRHLAREHERGIER